MRGFKWEQKHIDYVKSVYKGRYLWEVRDMFNNKFGMNISKNAINAKMNRLGVKSGIPAHGTREAHGHLQNLLDLKIGQYGYIFIKVDDKTNNQQKLETIPSLPLGTTSWESTSSTCHYLSKWR